MHFVEVKEIPPTRVNLKCKFEERLERFMRLNIKCAKVVYDINDYSSATACLISFRRASVMHGFPVDVKMRNGEVYLIRRDM